MKKLLRVFLLTVLMISCTKEDLLFQEVRLEQQGEYVVLTGYLREPVNYEFSYSVYAKFCDEWVELLVVLQPGETEAHRGYVFDQSVKCKFSDYEIRWKTALEQ